jgi:hypothetical protein
MPHADLDFNFNADNTQMDVDPAPVALEKWIENTPCPEPVSKKQKVNFIFCYLPSG